MAPTDRDFAKMATRFLDAADNLGPLTEETRAILNEVIDRCSGIKFRDRAAARERAAHPIMYKTMLRGKTIRVTIPEE